MRLRALPSLKRAGTQQIGANYDHIVSNRALLSWLHVGLAFAAALAYLSTTDTSFIRWWRRGAGAVALSLTFAALVPYIVSAVFSRSRVTAQRAGLLLFSLVLIAGTVAVGYLYVTRIADTIPPLGRFTVPLAQTVVYLVAATILLRGAKFEE